MSKKMLVLNTFGEAVTRTDVNYVAVTMTPERASDAVALFHMARSIEVFGDRLSYFGVRCDQVQAFSLLPDVLTTRQNLAELRDQHHTVIPYSRVVFGALPVENALVHVEKRLLHWKVWVADHRDPVKSAAIEVSDLERIRSEVSKKAVA